MTTVFERAMRNQKKRILICPDKFKGTLSARDAADAIERGWQKIRPADELVKVPMSDGGDGFGLVIEDLVGAKRRIARSCDASAKICSVPWWWHSYQALYGLTLPQTRWIIFGHRFGWLARQPSVLLHHACLRKAGTLTLLLHHNIN